MHLRLHGRAARGQGGGAVKTWSAFEWSWYSLFGLLAVVLLTILIMTATGTWPTETIAGPVVYKERVESTGFFGGSPSYYIVIDEGNAKRTVTVSIATYGTTNVGDTVSFEVDR